MRQTIKSGSVIERTQFFVGERKPRRDRRKGSTSEKAQINNLNQAVRRLARVINCNFTEKDALVTLTYDDEHLPDVVGAAKKLELFRRKLAYHFKRNETDLKAVWITADKDERTGTSVRLHHHIVISGLDLKTEDGHVVACIGNALLSDLWKEGFVFAEHLSPRQDYTPLANYLVRQAVDAPDAKKWNSTRNLEKPIIEREEIISAPKEIKAPPGATVLEVGAYDIETGSHYIRYIRKAKREKPKKKPKPKPKVLFVWSIRPTRPS